MRTKYPCNKCRNTDILRLNLKIGKNIKYMKNLIILDKQQFQLDLSAYFSLKYR